MPRTRSAAQCIGCVHRNESRPTRRNNPDAWRQSASPVQNSQRVAIQSSQRRPSLGLNDINPLTKNDTASVHRCKDFLPNCGRSVCVDCVRAADAALAPCIWSARQWWAGAPAPTPAHPTLHVPRSSSRDPRPTILVPRSSSHDPRPTIPVPRSSSHAPRPALVAPPRPHTTRLCCGRHQSIRAWDHVGETACVGSTDAAGGCGEISPERFAPATVAGQICRSFSCVSIRSAPPLHGGARAPRGSNASSGVPPRRAPHSIG
jgi:hypothetical protein